ncbi:MAG: tetratricopeptide repeat protein [Sandaracinaceae bacterium]|nr:tetratricopeptide repeat protein [Sandaracinaceae bacterium]
MRWAVTAFGTIFAVSGTACVAQEDETKPPQAPGQVLLNLPAEPLIPSKDPLLFPSNVRLDSGFSWPLSPKKVAELADESICAQCHPAIDAQHRAGPHANASLNNPWYRASFERLREEAGLRASRHCAGCHDPLLLLSGAIDAPLDPHDPLLAKGLSCALCHSIVEASPDGTGSYVLRPSDLEIPDPNDPESVAHHRARMAPPILRNPLLCASCHRGFLSPERTQTGSFLLGVDEAGAWRASAWAGQHAQRVDAEAVPARDCRGCHMEREAVPPSEFARKPDGSVASHRFAGGHLPIAAQNHVQRSRIEAKLKHAASIDIVGYRDAGGSFFPITSNPSLPIGEPILLEVVIHNKGVGHRLPGGARDIRDHFVVLEIEDARGRLVASAGKGYCAGEESDPTAYALRTAVLDASGHPDKEHLVHRFHALGWDHTIPPRDAALIRYEAHIPSWALPPFRLRASLFARRHTLSFSRFACDSALQKPAPLIERSAHTIGRPRMDPCAIEPVVELARFDSLSIQIDLPHRLWLHALASSHSRQEELFLALESAELALSLTDDPALRGALEWIRGEVFAKTGQLKEALEAASRAEALVGPHPAIDRLRGHAYAQVWNWEEAARAFERVAEAAPYDTEAHRDFARALGSIGKSATALRAATQGLRLFPRDESLLRSQALALERLSAQGFPVDPSTVEKAFEAWLAHRRHDSETQLRLRCEQEVPLCARDRMPVPRLSVRVVESSKASPTPTHTSCDRMP